MDGTLRTARLRLVPADVDALRAKYDGPAGAPDGVSPKWIEKLRVAQGPDPWEFGYTVVHAELQRAIGGVSFKGEVVDPEDGPVRRFEKRRPA